MTDKFIYLSIHQFTTNHENTQQSDDDAISIPIRGQLHRTNKLIRTIYTTNRLTIYDSRCQQRLPSGGEEDTLSKRKLDYPCTCLLRNDFEFGLLPW